MEDIWKRHSWKQEDQLEVFMIAQNRSHGNQAGVREQRYQKGRTDRLGTDWTAQKADTVGKSTGSGLRLPGSGPDFTLTTWGTLGAFLNTFASTAE